MLSIIHEIFDAIPLSGNYILQLHKIMYSHTNNPIADQTKNVQNYISAAYPDGNGRMSRLLTTLLLYRCGFYVGKYISLEAKIAKNKDLYYDALNRSQHGWHEGAEDVLPFIKYLLETILAAYKDFGERFAIVEEKLPAIDMVRKATLNRIGRFTKQDIREQCPSLSLSSVEGALRKLVATGELKREGAGKSTCYVRLKFHCTI